MDDERAEHQDIRPMNILIFEFNAAKTVTETQLLRHLANTPLQLRIEFLYMSLIPSKHSRADYMDLYKTLMRSKVVILTV